MSTSTPPCAAHASLMMRRCSASASAYFGAELVEEPRRALDVGEEDCDRAGRKVGSHEAIICGTRRNVQSRGSKERIAKDRSSTGSFDWLDALIGALAAAGVALAICGVLVARYHVPSPAR